MPTPTPTHEQLAHELTELDGETRALMKATAELYRLAYERRDNVTDEDVASLREARRDCGRSRQIVAGLVRRWNAGPEGGAS